MYEYEILRRLKNNDNQYHVSMHGVARSSLERSKLANTFRHVAKVADEANIGQIKIVFDNLENWSTHELDVVYQTSRDLIADNNEFKKNKKVRKLGFWFEKTESYAFRVFNSDLA